MKHDKLLKIYQSLSLEDKNSLMNMFLSNDSYFFIASDKRGMGFDVDNVAENVFSCLNGTQLQINIEMDKTFLCSVNTKKVNLDCKKWDKVKLNSFIADNDKVTLIPTGLN